MKLLFLEDTMWDYDFIINDILYSVNTEVELYNKSTFKLLLKRNDIIEKNILVINRVFNINDIIEIVKIIKPIIIIYTSDEVGNIHKVPQLENYTRLLLRQYNHKQYKYSEKNYQLPLGYSKYYLQNETSLSITPKRMIERKINCSFIGCIKSDRKLHRPERKMRQKCNKNILLNFI